MVFEYAALVDESTARPHAWAARVGRMRGPALQCQMPKVAFRSLVRASHILV